MIIVFKNVEVLSKQCNNMEEHKSQVQMVGDLVPRPSLIRCMLLGKSSGPSEPQLSHVKLGITLPALPNPGCNDIK